ncbi:MAG: hypothetical protein LBB48_08720 [Treponema sp.]|jgi:hypothetical protein|nr:hypothetical protein [Treponema sp.]
MTVENRRIPDKIRETPRKGRIKALIPRDTRRNEKEREVVLLARYARYEIKKPRIRNKNEGPLPSLSVKVTYVKEERPPQGIEGIERFPMTNEEPERFEAAYKMAG